MVARTATIRVSQSYHSPEMIMILQHMTAQLVLERPENTLEFMMNWCKEMQSKQHEERLKAKMLYEQNKIDVYDDDDTSQNSRPTERPNLKTNNIPHPAYGNELLKSHASSPTPRDVDSKSIERNTEREPIIRDGTLNKPIGNVDSADDISVSDEEDTISISSESEIS